MRVAFTLATALVWTTATANAESGPAMVGRCLEFSAVDSNQPISRPISVLAEVHARNTCGESFAGDHLWITAQMLNDRGDVIGSQSGHFTGTIEGHSEAQTLIEVACNPQDVHSMRAKFRSYDP